MANNSNRGRDIPRAPQFKRKKNPNSDQVGDPIKMARRRDTTEKALAKATKAHGFDTLFATGKVMPEKSKQKEHKLVLEALALHLPVHPRLLEFHGLVEDLNPPTLPEDTSKAPF